MVILMLPPYSLKLTLEPPLPRFSRSCIPFVIPFHHTDYGKNNPIDRMMRLANLHPTLFNL